jgi:two-component system chemotaxis response regulator CheY
MKLLVVDDSNIIRSRIARVVLLPKLRGLTVVGLAQNGLEAIEICQRVVPDLVTMDLTMPEMDGNTCIEELVSRYPEINILVVSALSDKATAIDALKRGARGFLYKPFTDEQLANALLELMSG